MDFRTRGNLANIPGASFFFDRQFEPITGFEDYLEGNQKNESLLQMNYHLWYVPVGSVADSAEAEVDAFLVFAGRRWVRYAVMYIDLGLVNMQCQ